MAASRDNDAAIERYRSYLDFDPNNPLLWISLGDLYHRAGRFDEAIAAFESAQRHDPENSVPRSRIASVFITQNRFEEAERLLRELTPDDGATDPMICHNLGVSLYYQMRWQEAQAAFERVQASGSALPGNLGYLVRSLHHEGETARALELAKQWETEEPTTAVQGYLSLIEMDHGDLDGALKRAEQVLQKEPENTDARVVVGSSLLEQQEMDRALEHFQKVVEAEPDNPRAWMGLGLIQLYRQQPRQAIQTLEKALRFMPDNYGTVVVIGWAKIADKDYPAAERSFRQAIEMNRNFAEAHGGLASALALQQRLDEARQAIELSRRLDRNGFGAMFAQSVILGLEGKQDQAAALLRSALERAPRLGGTPLIATIQLYARLHMVQPAPEKAERS